MQVAYKLVGGRIYRPILRAHVWGPAGGWPVDGLLDSGADITLLPLSWANKIGLDVTHLPDGAPLHSATGHSVPCKVATIILELRFNSTRLCWSADVSVALAGI